MLTSPCVSGLQSSEWDREHAKHYIDYIDSTFTSEGHVPNMAEADEVGHVATAHVSHDPVVQVFTPVNPDESLNFNESRLSLGLGRASIGSTNSNNYQAIDGMRLVTRSVVVSVAQQKLILYIEHIIQAKHRGCERLRRHCAEQQACGRRPARARVQELRGLRDAAAAAEAAPAPGLRRRQLLLAGQRL